MRGFAPRGSKQGHIYENEAGEGRVDEAMQRFIIPGVAAGSTKVRSKFAGIGAEVEDFVEQFWSFDACASAGPIGLRFQFSKELVGKGGDVECVAAWFRVVLMFVEGRVSSFLWWYTGGILKGFVMTTCL